MPLKKENLDVLEAHLKNELQDTLQDEQHDLLEAN
jgi:hypothetical protein